MEDEAKEGCKKPEVCYKAGWLKKDTGRLLSSYKDCYVHVEKTELVVYESEETKTCLERIDLENYDKCRELKNPFKRKQRLILIKLQKSGNKVHDIKLQAQNAEEKDSWIKVLCDAISRAKNKYLDVVTTDESLNLEHVTRTRPKGNRNRRPPTRIHMKEVAILSEDGTMYLDLDRMDGVSSNGTHSDYANIESPVSLTEVKDSPGPCLDQAKTEQDVSVVKKKIKPPMPPIKEARPSEPEKTDPLLNKDLETSKSAEIQPCESTTDGATEKDETQKTPETSPDLEIKINPPPSPTITPKNGTSSPKETLQPGSSNKPPAIPCKGKKPVITITKPDQEVHKPTDEVKYVTSSPTESESSGAQEHVPEEVLEETVAIIVAPPVPPKKITQPSVEPVSDQVGNYPENSTKAKEKPADSGQLSDDGVVGSLSEDTVAAAMTDRSQLSLDVSDDDEHGIQVLDVHSQVGVEESLCQLSVPTPPPKPLVKAKSASHGDLLFKSSNQDISFGTGEPSDDVAKLKLEVSMQMEKTNELLFRLSKLPNMDIEEDGSVNQLAEAMKKLKRADVVLMEGEELSPPKNESNRKSW